MNKDLCDSSYIDLGGTNIEWHMVNLELCLASALNNCPECFLEKLREQLWEDEGGAVKKEDEEE